jgi:hypothetical protein
LLRVSIEQGPEGQPCFWQHADIPIPLRIVPQRESAAWHVEMAKELATPIPANGHPLVRITVLRKSGGSTLLLSMHHSIADGLSSAFVIRDILEALSVKPLQPLTLTEPQESLCSAAASTSPPPPPAPAYSPATLLRRDVGGPTIQALKLSRELAMKLWTHAREVGATVHGALVAAFTFAGRQLSSDWLTHSVRVVSPENNRSVLPFETSVGNFKLKSLWGPSVFVSIEGERMVGVATLKGAIHLLHTSYTPIPKLLQTMEATLEVMTR